MIYYCTGGVVTMTYALGIVGIILLYVLFITTLLCIDIVMSALREKRRSDNETSILLILKNRFFNTILHYKLDIFRKKDKGK